METRAHTFMDIFDTDFSVVRELVRLKKIVIPIIQRDYAQGRTDEDSARIRARFLRALHEAVSGSPATLDFVYGDIDEAGTMTPLDGQQRLTTLFLLHWYAAKKGGAGEDEYSFLYNFSYETRYSARDFCSLLIGFDPSFEGSISEEITDQFWFPLDWQKDPTIRAMLVMLDDIQDVFADIDGLWEKLKGRAIQFYFLPIREMGLTDELYIKMNSRGKPLTAFEHFKAELEHEIRQADEELCRRIMRKIDIDWTDMLWKYRGSNNITDDEFLRYLRFVCDILCYRSGGTMQGRRMSGFDLLNEFFSPKCENAKENLLSLESFFDVWCFENLGSEPDEFLGRFISTEHEAGKILIDSRPDLFGDCLENYTDGYGMRTRMFPLGRVVLLYAAVVYLMNRQTVTEAEFARRLRVVHNLAENSEDELSDSTQRTSGNRMPAILRQTDCIIRTGRIDRTIEGSFNQYQLNEEEKKLEWTEQNPEYAEALFALEDHELLYGRIAVVGLDEPELFGRFAELFACDKDAVDCALTALGDYTQQDGAAWRYQTGSSRILSSWMNLFHNVSAAGFGRTREILHRLLKRRETFSDGMLRGIADRYLAACEEKRRYDWRYYYLRYGDVFRPGRYGKIYWEDKAGAPYEMLMLYAGLYLSQNAYQPFLKLLDEEALSRDDWGQWLVRGDYWIECRNDGFYLYAGAEAEEPAYCLEIAQDEKGVDTEDRVKKAGRWYRKLCRRLETEKS